MLLGTRLVGVRSDTGKAASASSHPVSGRGSLCKGFERIAPPQPSTLFFSEGPSPSISLSKRPPGDRVAVVLTLRSRPGYGDARPLNALPRRREAGRGVCPERRVIQLWEILFGPKSPLF